MYLCMNSKQVAINTNSQCILNAPSCTKHFLDILLIKHLTSSSITISKPPCKHLHHHLASTSITTFPQANIFLKVSLNHKYLRYLLALAPSSKDQPFSSFSLSHFRATSKQPTISLHLSHSRHYTHKHKPKISHSLSISPRTHTQRSSYFRRSKARSSKEEAF